MDSTSGEAASHGRIAIKTTWGFLIPCFAYLMIGLALYPQLGLVAHYFNVELRGEPTVTEWVFAGLWFMIIGICGVLVHELGHAIVIKFSHHRNAVIALTANVGTRHGPLESSTRFMALSGPILQIAYGLTVLFISMAVDGFYFALLGGYILADATFNMLPIKGHDGYIVFRKNKTSD